MVAFTKPRSDNLRDKRHVLNNEKDLRDFCSTYVKKPIENFLGSVAQSLVI